MFTYISVACIIYLIGNTHKSLRIVGLKRKSAYKKNKYNDRQLLLVVFCLLLVYLVGFRDSGGADDASYRLYYENGYGQDSLWGFLTGKEPSFLLLAKIAQLMQANYKMLFLLYAIIIFGFIFAALKNFKLTKSDTAIYCLAFLPVALPAVFTTMRQAAAMAVILYYYSLEKPDIRKRIAYFTVAFLFHYSAIIFVLIEIVRLRFGKCLVTNKAIKIIFPFCCLIIGNVVDFTSIISKITNAIGMYTYMNQQNNYTSEFNVGIFTFFLFVCYLLKVMLSKSHLFTQKSIGSNDEKAETIEQLQMLYFSMAFITANLRWGSRIQLFYLFFVPFVFIDLINMVEEKSKMRLLLGPVLIFFFWYVMGQNESLLYIVRTFDFWG